VLEQSCGGHCVSRETTYPHRMMTVRPENELLLCCARTQLESKETERIRALLQKEIDWPHLCKLGNRHRLVPLLFKNLKSACPDGVPDAIMDRFHDQFIATAGHNLFLTNELLTLLHLFESHDIPAIPYKGPVLAASIYGDIALRQFGDLDILVRKQDLPRAKGLLVSSGYHPIFDLGPIQERAYLRSDGGGPFEREDKRVIVEMEWEITPREFPVPLDVERFWEKTEWTSFEGRAVPVLAPEDLLLTLCVHGAKHCWDQLNWVCDIAELMRTRKEMDWPRVMEEAHAVGCERMLLLGLVLAQDFMAADLPEIVRQGVERDSMVKTLVDDVGRRFFDSWDSPRGAFDLSLFYLRATKRLRDKTGFCLRLAFGPTIDDRRLLSLPPSLSFLYYLIHPACLMGKYGIKPLRSFFNGNGKA
jgi:hypothetical protein